MKHFVDKLKSNPKNTHFLLYCYAFIVYGAYINCIGPIIPYLARFQSQDQTHYTSFFTIRTLAYIIGALIIKSIITKYSYHSILGICTFVIFWGSLVFNANFQYAQELSVFGVSIMYAIMDPIMNMILLMFNDDQDKQFWVLIGHSMFGVGCLAAPFVVRIWQLDAFTVLGLVNLISIVGYYWLKSPEDKNKKAKDVTLSDNSDNNSQSGQYVVQYKISKKSLYMLSILFLVYIGEQVTFGGWVSSYSVLTGFANEQQATFVCSLFYVFITVFRLVFSLIPQSSRSQTLRTFLIYKILASIVVVILQIYSPQLASYTACILYGIIMAPLYSKFLTFSHDFNIQLTGQDYSTIVIIGMLGEAVLAAASGWLMGFSPYYFYYCMLAMGIASYVILIYLIRTFKDKDKQAFDNIIEMDNSEKNLL